ncbi:MAG: GNAT family N-acetyltransferase [Chloroflexi bacterium]|nr:GNAT family N-acetyltransferase [Chloroflexota bacterium]
MHLTHPRFTLRPMTDDDLPALLDVYRQCEDFLALGPNPHASRAMIEDDWRLSREQHGDFNVILAPDGRMIGVLDVVFGGYQGQAERAYIELLMIAVPYRAKGLGTDVVRAIEAEIIRRPAIRQIGLGAQVNNPGAVRFWQRMGYRITDGPELMPDQTTVYHMSKTIGNGDLAAQGSG